MSEQDDWLEIYVAHDGDWRWRRKADNGEIIAMGEGHKNQADATRAAKRANPGIRIARWVGDSTGIDK